MYDDFLSFDTHKVYELIIANFPFSEGDQHLQHALDLLEKNGGNLVCLVNAETLKNPYSTIRQVLARKLSDYGATIEYLEGEFTDAERKTDVEVALIRASVEKTASPSLILDSLKKAKEVEAAESFDSKLIEKDFLKALVARFTVECEIGVRLIEEYFSLKPYIMDRLQKATDNYGNELIELKIEGAYGDKAAHINAYLRGVRHKFWEILVNDPRFTSQYTSNILAELNKKLEKLRDCDFNLFNIRELEEELNRKIVDGVESSIMNLFDELSGKYAWHSDVDNGNVHYFNGWKTNRAHKINSKVILPINGFSAFSKDRLDYYVHQRLTDMVKVFNYLAGGMENVPVLVGQTIRSADAVHDFTGMDLRYFETTFYKKGTCHIRFKDAKLLEKFNIYGSQRKGWLPPSYGKKAYRDLDPEERTVIDDFQGEAQYNAVVEDAGYYLAADQAQFLLG